MSVKNYVWSKVSFTFLNVKFPLHDVVMKIGNFNLDGRKAYFTVLITAMISSVILFNADYELISAGVIIAAVSLLYLIRENSSKPVFDERDLSLAEESSHAALMWTGALGGILMIFISIGMGTGYLQSYPEQVAPYYLSWGGIIALAAIIEAVKRIRGTK